jgi:hypothetical protein
VAGVGEDERRGHPSKATGACGASRA